MSGAELGDPDIVVRDVEAAHRGHRLAGAPCNDPFRLRVVSRDGFGLAGTQTLKADVLRPTSKPIWPQTSGSCWPAAPPTTGVRCGRVTSRSSPRIPVPVTASNP